MTKFDVILIDPPWEYRDKASSGKRGVGYKYNTMSIGALSGLDLRSVTNDDCAMFMWTTFPQLDVAIELMQSWGFNYKTVAFVWIKTPKGKKPSLKIGIDDIKMLIKDMGKKKSIIIPLFKYLKLHWGMGNWTRSNSEMVLLGTVGKPKRVDAGVHQVVISELREHSEKPVEVHKRIERLLGQDVSRLEIFGREKVEGWTVIGKDIDGLDIRDALESLSIKK